MFQIDVIFRCLVFEYTQVLDIKDSAIEFCICKQ